MSIPNHPVCRSTMGFFCSWIVVSIVLASSFIFELEFRHKILFNHSSTRSVRLLQWIRISNTWEALLSFHIVILEQTLKLNANWIGQSTFFCCFCHFAVFRNDHNTFVKRWMGFSAESVRYKYKFKYRQLVDTDRHNDDETKYYEVQLKCSTYSIKKH